MYLINREVNPFEKNFIKKYCSTGKDFNKNIYALSDLIQWIWRSSIRNNKEISIYIPSKKMRNIFLGWLNSYSSSNFIDNDFKKQYLEYINEDVDTQNLNSTDETEITTQYPNEIYLKDFNDKDELSDKEKKFKYDIMDKMSHLCFNDKFEIEKYSYLLEKNIYELSKQYTYRVIYLTILSLEKELNYASNGKINNQYIANKVKYLITIIANHIEIVNKEIIEKDRRSEDFANYVTNFYKKVNSTEAIVSKPTKRRDFSIYLDEGEY